VKICALLLWLFAAGAAAETFTAKVIAVLDGDTVMVQQGKKKSTVRLAGIDAPEKLQAHGAASRDALAALVLQKDVSVTTKTVDDYGRLIALMHLGSVNVSEAQLRRGMAWEYSQYHRDKALVELQAEARQARRGLWADAQPQPPWEFRKMHVPTRELEAGHTACGRKHYCSQMASCEEATFYLTQCRVKTLDKDGDGVPCENLCSARPARK
jgi:endonuclease YncB( thermonuclease family)